jgi:phosphoribosylaminoimidazole (AIR) synthetase
MTGTKDTYAKTGVDVTMAGSALGRLSTHINAAMGLRKGRAGNRSAGFGYYANVLDLGNNLGLAVSTDGVGTKLDDRRGVGQVRHGRHRLRRDERE